MSAEPLLGDTQRKPRLSAAPHTGQREHTGLRELSHAFCDLLFAAEKTGAGPWKVLSGRAGRGRHARAARALGGFDLTDRLLDVAESNRRILFQAPAEQSQDGTGRAGGKGP